MAATKLGEKYRDTQTGIEGTAISSTKYQHGCERIQLEWVVNGEIKIDVFDAPRLVLVADGSRVGDQNRPGGNQAVAPQRSVPGRR